MATTTWTTVERKKVWPAPMTATRLQRLPAYHPDMPPMRSLPREDASHPRMPARSEWPSLGSMASAHSQWPSGGSMAPAPAVPKLDFKAMATDATARFARQEAEAAAAAAETRRREEQDRMGRFVSHAEIEHRRRLASIPTRCYDDGPDDYDPPEEDDLETDAYGCPTSYEYRGYDYERPDDREEDDEEEEFNAQLAITRRAGDKSDW